jgi:uncharacterized protein (TIGR03435 family)
MTLNTKSALWSSASLAGALIVAGCLLVYGQSSSPSQFEVVSIKPNTSDDPRIMGLRSLPGGRLEAVNAPARLLIQNAYNVKNYQIVGGPPWIENQRYNIEAKAEGNASQTQLMLMLQGVLTDRFMLKTHRETRELPVYVLSAAKNGPQLPAPEEGDCVTVDPNAPGPPNPPPPPGSGQVQMFPCGRIPGISLTPTDATLEGRRVLMTDLTQILSRVMGRTVLDKTGFTKPFNVHLVFTPDDSLAGVPAAGRPGIPAADVSGRSLFNALQEELGLKLESSKGPVEVIVIDHIEKPATN